MLIWAIYDIRENKVRTKIAKYCKQKGLYRVQKSVFWCEIEKNQLDELKIESGRLFKRKMICYIFPMWNRDFKKVILLGQAFDRELVTDEI
jgi:CRISPR-associated protein Cas2